MIYKVTATVTAVTKNTHQNEGTQWKKKVYVNQEKFNNHSEELIKRWSRLGFSISVFRSVDGKNWIDISNISVNQINDSLCYGIIKDFYGDKKADRGGIPFINHINEGLAILNTLGACKNTKDAYCLHPIFQIPDSLKKAIAENTYTDIDPLTLIYVMEYRNKANAFVCRERTDHYEVKDLPVMVLPQVADMLIADKIQNYRSFVKHHKGTHARSNQLEKYFNLWFKHLNVNIKDPKWKQ